MLPKEVIRRLLLKEVNKIPSLQQQLDLIISKIQKKYIPSAMKKEVSWESKTTMQKHVIEDVYDKYNSSYDNKYHMGGLLDIENIETKMIDDNTLRIENIRKDEESGRLVTPVVEFGKGYYTDWLDERIGARPFIYNTFEELKNGKALIALKKGLLRQGLNVK